MRFFSPRLALLFIWMMVFYACKKDDGPGYIPLNIDAQPDTAEVYQNESIEISILANDINVPEEGIILLTAPQNGSATLNNNGTPDYLLDDTVVVSPDPTFYGQISFEYTVCDSTQQSCATATVTVNVLPVSPVIFDLAEVPYPKLSDYNFYEGSLANLSPVYGVLPYEPINTLFTDYALKKRFVWMPNDVSATYVSDTDNLNFPVGSVLIKTFYYENVLPDLSSLNIETRLMIKKEEGWIFANYIWDEAQQEALLNTTGRGFNVPVEWLEKGESKSVNYRIPSESECFLCHKSFDAPIPIAPKPQNLNSIYSYADGMENQLQKWEEIGYIASNDIPSHIETVPSWKDLTQTLETRVRSYFDINCAHCHVYGGHCGARSLRLAFNQTEDLYNMGVCMEPDLQVPGYDGAKLIMPGDAENSPLFFRMATTLEEYRMPMNGRTLTDEDFLPVLEEWINSLTLSCD